MDMLIKKAIQAIKDGKTEYAIGLLEGALEMVGSPIVSGGAPGSAPIATFSQQLPIPTGTINGNDEGAMMDATAAARLAAIKDMSERSLQ